MKVIIGADHTGFELKEKIIDYIKNKNIEVIDNGNLYDEKDDYPDIAYELCTKVANGDFDKGILICGSGIGMSIAANKVNGIRCGVCNEEYLIEMARKDNDINVLSVGARVIEFEKVKRIIDIFLETKFLGERHLRRVEKIEKIEQKMKEGK